MKARRPSKNLRGSLTCLSVIGVLLGATAMPVQALDVSERFAVNADTRFELSNVSGDIRVSGWEHNEVLIEGDLAKNAELEVETSPRHIAIKVVKKPGARRMGSSELRVQVPFAAELSLYGVSGDIEVEAVHGTQRIEVVSGDIEVLDFDHDVRVRSVKGDVKLSGSGSSSLVTVVSVSGDIDIRNLAGELEATSISGNLDIEGGEFSRVRLNSTSGDVEFAGGIANEGRLGVEVISGEVEIDLSSTVNLDVDIESYSGKISNCLGEEVQRKRKYGPGQVLRFTSGKGNRTVHIQALSGDVGLCAK